MVKMFPTCAFQQNRWGCHNTRLQNKYHSLFTNIFIYIGRISNINITNPENKACHLVATNGTSILVPYQTCHSNSLEDQVSLGIRPSVSCSDLTNWYGTSLVVPVMATRVTCPYFVNNIQYPLYGNIGTQPNRWVLTHWPLENAAF